MHKLIWILWPAFIVGGVAETVFFTVLDPQDLQMIGLVQGWGRTAVYSTGFFAFWMLAAASSALTCFLQRTADEINQCPLSPLQRPEGCPKRDDPQATCSASHRQ